MNFENLVFQNFQTPTVGKTLKPYQGLKQQSMESFSSLNSSRKNLKTLSGIETPETHLLKVYQTKSEQP